MTRAAAELGIQPSPLSQQIRALEAEFGLALFQRHPKGVTLTDAGKTLLVDARRIVQDVTAMRQRMAGVASGLQCLLAVGFTSSAAAHRFTPDALRACRGAGSRPRAQGRRHCRRPWGCHLAIRSRIGSMLPGLMPLSVRKTRNLAAFGPICIAVPVALALNLT